MPKRARRTVGQVEWMPRVLEDSDAVFRRADWRRSVALVVRELTFHARWYALEADAKSDGMEMTTRPTWARLVERTDLSRRTVARVLAWLRRRGWIAVVETGTTERIRAGLLFPLADPHAGEGNRAAVYLLTVPVGEPPLSSLEEATRPAPAAHAEPTSEQVNGLGIQVAPLPGSPPASAMKSTYAGAREASAGGHGSGDNQTDRTKDSSNRAEFGVHSQVPTGRWTQRERLRAAETARAADPVLRRLSARAVRSLLTPWWDAGWTIADVIHALNHRPDGPWTIEYAAVSDLRNVAGWVRWRFDHWRDAHGTPVPSHGQRERARTREADARAQARREALRAADAPPSAPARAVAGFEVFRAARRASGLTTRRLGR